MHPTLLDGMHLHLHRFACCIWLLTTLICGAGYITVFLVALATDRAFLLHQPNDTRSRWEDIYEEKHISWRAEKPLDYAAEKTRDDFYHLDLWCAASLDRDLAFNTAAALPLVLSDPASAKVSACTASPRTCHTMACIPYSVAMTLADVACGMPFDSGAVERKCAVHVAHCWKWLPGLVHHVRACR